ncbi:hypothetical protein HY624_04235 [Candidatus Uhrbacteria bacterium]|nr:hypothetical protein [Candidatus Uhrbacteria bacterium]
MRRHLRGAIRAVWEIGRQIAATAHEPTVLIVGHDTGFMVSVHCNDPVEYSEKTRDTEWREKELFRVDLRDFETNEFAIAAVARHRWSEINVFSCQCTCCTDGLVVVEETEYTAALESLDPISL